MNATTAYSDRINNWSAIVAGTVCVGVVIRLDTLQYGQFSSFDALWIVVFYGAFYLAMTSMRTTVGPRGVTVRHGLLGLPRFRYRIDRIEQAEVVEIGRARFGLPTPTGRGISLRRPLLVRPGSCLELYLSGERSVIVSVHDPDTAAAVVNRYVRQSRSVPEAGGR